MKRRRNIVITGLLLCFFIIIAAGCAKKTTIAEEPVFVTKEQPAAVEQSAETAAPESAASLPPAVSEESEKDWLQKQLAQGRDIQELAAKESTAEGAAGPSRGTVELDDIHFSFDQYDLSSEARNVLKQHADWLLKHDAFAVVIEGHCDERGTTEYNLALGQRRASEAMKFLIDLGVDGKRIKTISYGKEMPLDPGHNEDAWAKNRRDHFVINAPK